MATKKRIGIPSVVQLPGGIKLNGVAFRVVERHANGSPRLFEIMPPGEPMPSDGWTLFADEDAIRKPRQ